MQIVIDILPKEYEAICKVDSVVDVIPFRIAQAIKNGTVLPEKPIIHCKECAYFEYDVVKNVDGIPLIVAHEMCSKWGDGCKTKEDGYCFLFEPKESEDKE